MHSALIIVDLTSSHFSLKDNLEEKEEKLNKLYESPYYAAGYREGRGKCK